MSRENPKDTCARCSFYAVDKMECRASLPRGGTMYPGNGTWLKVESTEWCRSFREISMVTRARETPK